MGDYSYVIDSTFQPFSMQEMLVPFTAYKEAFEKTEEAYTDLSDKSDKFKYLSETLPEGSKARALYEGYANDLKQRAEDLAHNGLTMGNRRALTSMKRRYQGEIGRLSEADERLKEEKKLRQTLNAQDSSRIYSTENLSIDDFLDNNNPNLYSVSGKELYAAGAAAGKAASSRVFSVDGSNRTLNDYYIEYVQKMGYSPETIQRFYEDMSTIPELQRAAADIATQYGVDKNLTGYGLERATKNILRGMMDGAVYQESHSPQRDLGKMTAAESAADARAKQQTAISAWSQGLKSDGKGGFVEDPENINYKAKDLTMKQQQAQFDAIYEPDPNKALTTLRMKDLASNDGFDVIANKRNYHYDYIGATSKHDGEWVHGAIGDDVPKRGWGFTSSSNVESAWGNFSAEGSDSNKMRVLNEDEAAVLMDREPGVQKAIEDRFTAFCAKKGIDPNGSEANKYDVQLIEVPNESDSSKKGYLIAVAHK